MPIERSIKKTHYIDRSGRRREGMFPEEIRILKGPGPINRKELEELKRAFENQHFDKRLDYLIKDARALIERATKQELSRDGSEADYAANILKYSELLKKCLSTIPPNTPVHNWICALATVVFTLGINVSRRKAVRLHQHDTAAGAANRTSGMRGGRTRGRALQHKRRATWAQWQSFAETIWNARPELTVRSVAILLAKKTGQKPETIRRRIRRPKADRPHKSRRV